MRLVFWFTAAFLSFVFSAVFLFYFGQPFEATVFAIWTLCALVLTA